MTQGNQWNRTTLFLPKIPCDLYLYHIFKIYANALHFKGKVRNRTVL